jgi:hypothetical protein
MKRWKRKMSDFSEKLAKARANVPTKDVTVVLDGDTNERDRLEAELEAADDDTRLASKSPADEIRERLAELEATGSVETLRFTRLPGKDWSVLTSLHPVRPDVMIDRHYGYNFDAVCEAAARFRDKSGRAYGARLEDGIPVELTNHEWSELFDVLSGSDIGKIRDAIWALNEYEPEQRRQALVKGSGAATRSDAK